MNIISSNQTKNTVSLEQLVPQHDCLKLLILHTPYTLNISTLPLCLNLIKLDLSKNNLQYFPYLGHLRNLKFLFIHENKLDIVQLRGIFQEKQERSPLALNIVWATFWGNKNSFLGRHYLISQTSVVAVDKNLVTYQQKCEAFPFFQTLPPFDQNTDISHLLRKKMINRHASQEEYMSELWLELKQLRTRYQQIFPVIKIQKWARGWLVRHKFQKSYQNKKIATDLKQLYFVQWKKHILRVKKLKNFLKERNRQYLLEQGKQGRVKELQMKVLDWGKDVKRKLQVKKLRFSNQIKVYNIMRQNYLTLKGLYQTLNLKASSAVYIHKNSWQNFQKHIIPMVGKRNDSKIVGLPNKHFIMQYSYECSSETSSQFVKIVNTNLKSSIFEASKDKKNIKKLRRFTERINLKKIYQPIHLSTKKILKIKEHQRNLNQKQQYGLQQLVKVQGNQFLLKDIVRAIYFYNISNRSVNDHNRINAFSEGMLKMIISAVRIQKVWRGFYFRKRNQKYLKVVMKMQRAAIIIQRWCRKLPIYHKKYFMIKTTKQLNKIQDKNLFIEMNDYLSLLKTQKESRRPVFMQQNSCIYLNKQSKMICLAWNHMSTSHQIHSNIKMGRIMFSHSFFKKTIGLTSEQIEAKTKYSQKMHLSDLSHLFHYLTSSTIIKKQNKSYLSLSFQSKSQARLRFLMLKLLTYSYKNNNGAKCLSSTEMGNFEVSKEIKIESPLGCVFICNENVNLLKICQEKLNLDNFRLHLVSNKFYVKGQKKVNKMQEKFIIYASKTDENPNLQVQNLENGQKMQQKRYRTELSNSFLDNRELLRERQIQLQANQDLAEQIKLRKVLNKRSMKQFKIDKRVKQKKPNPSFILDSISINERLTTQPDYLPTYQSNAENSVNPNEKTQKSVQRSQSKQVSVRPLKSQFKSAKHSYAEKAKALSKRKQDESFIKRFVNIGNFIQNQFANDYRRRIKTQCDNTALQSAENIKRSLQRSQSQRMQQAQEKLKTIKERHSQHRQIVNSHEQTSKQKFQKMKSQVREERQKRTKDKGKVKRLKVSFAQECYPLATRTKKTDYFP